MSFLFVFRGFTEKNFMIQSKGVQKIVVISAINFFEGGPLSILKDCLLSFKLNDDFARFRIIALVHKVELLNDLNLPNVECIEFPQSRNSYFFRFFYEYFYFKYLSYKLNPFFWFSLHDMTPNVGNVPQAVYCHNPSPFDRTNLGLYGIQPTQLLFRLFYRYIYKINIKRNQKVIVQQQWLAKEFLNLFKLKQNQILVAKPEFKISTISDELTSPKEKEHSEIVFVFPAYPRLFKNFEVICKAIVILNSRNVSNFQVLLTIDGSENRYSKSIVDQYGGTSNLYFIGIKSRKEIFELYRMVDCLLFPSKLETWGLPLSEFMNFNKPIFVSNLPYAIETLNGYDKAYLFNPDDEFLLADALESFIKDAREFKYSVVDAIFKEFDEVNSWEDLFKKLIDPCNV